MAFSASDAAFEGFRLVRRNPLAIVAWSLLYFALGLVTLFATAMSIESLTAMTEMMEAMEASPPTTIEGWAPFFTTWSQAMSATAWTLPLSLAVSAMLSAAVARGVLTPEAKGFGYLRFGMDEVRVFVVTVVLTVATAVIGSVAFGAVFLLGGMAIALGQPWLWLFVFLGFLAAFALVIWLSVRWSLAAPIVVAEKRFAFFDSFRLTRGRFWPLFGMAIIAGIMALIIWGLSMVVAMPLNMMSGINMMGGAANSAALAESFDLANPWVIAAAVVNAIIYALMIGVLYAPFAAAYRDLVDYRAEQAFD